MAHTLIAAWAISLVLNLLLYSLDHKRGYFYADRDRFNVFLFMFFPIMNSIYLLVGIAFLIEDCINGEY